MEKHSFIKNGVLRLPPGFRFHPTDEELILEYLRPKVFARPLPASIIPEVEVSKSDPWDLPGDDDGGQERYFFSTREAKYPNGHRSNRATGAGFWKATGIDKKIVVNQAVRGVKKTLIFYRGKPHLGARTDWVMHEYRLGSSYKNNSTQNKGCSNSSMPPTEKNWVLCRIFLKKKRNASTKNESVKKPKSWPEGDDTKPIFHDFMRKKEMGDLNLAPPTCSSSESSGLTNVTCCEPEEEEDGETNTSSSFSLQI